MRCSLAARPRTLSLPSQVVEGTGAPCGSAAIVCVGEVVRLRAGLDWLGAIAGRSLDPDPLDLRQASETG